MNGVLDWKMKEGELRRLRVLAQDRLFNAQSI